MYLRRVIGVFATLGLAVPGPAIAYLPRVPGPVPPTVLAGAAPLFPWPEALLQAQVDEPSTPSPTSPTSPPSRDDRDTVRPTSNEPLSDKATGAIVETIDRGMDLCERLPWDYRLDCLYHIIDRAAKRTPNSRDYAPVKQALSEAARDLDRLRDKHANNKGDRKGFRSADGRVSVPTLTPIKPESRAQVTRATDRIIEEAQTVLLRSAGDDPEELAQFTRVVQAVESSKLLLRSARRRRRHDRTASRPSGSDDRARA